MASHLFGFLSSTCEAISILQETLVALADDVADSLGLLHYLYKVPAIKTINQSNCNQIEMENKQI